MQSNGLGAMGRSSVEAEDTTKHSKFNEEKGPLKVKANDNTTEMMKK